MNGAAKAVSIGRINLLRQVRERSNLFFVFVLPTIIVLALGLQFSGAGAARIGIMAPANDPAAEELIAAIESAEAGFDVRRPTDAAVLRDQVERGFLEIGLIVPEGYGASLESGDVARLELLGTPESVTTGLRTTIESALGRQAAIALAARIAVDGGAGAPDAARAAASAAYPEMAGVDVTVTPVGEPSPFAGVGQFEFGAQTQLVLFMFLTSLTAAASLVLTKNLGVSRRMFSTPTGAGTIVVGEALGRFSVALLQGIYIVVVTAVVFGVGWGDPLAAAGIVLSFGLVCAAFAMLVGALSRNAEQAGALGVAAGLGLGALGGAMVPASFMPPFMLTIAQATPHYWAIDGLGRLSRGDTVTEVALDLGVLLAYGAVVMAVAAWRFRRSLTG